MTSLALAALGLASVPTFSVLGVAVWGLGSGAFPPLAQTLILRVAGPEHRDFAGALIPVLFNAGIALGAGAASGLVGAGGPMMLPIPAAIVVLAAALALAVAEASRRPATVPNSHAHSEGSA
ncbi:MFS transporter [Rathayibacter sp. KR2-224]|uniref:MFS transporter n=1 Tax=Rathayibacter sp. KR2-224 TaxID=3400913 RepID=UPI003BFE3F94